MIIESLGFIPSISNLRLPTCPHPKFEICANSRGKDYLTMTNQKKLFNLVRLISILIILYGCLLFLVQNERNSSPSSLHEKKTKN